MYVNRQHKSLECDMRWMRMHIIAYIRWKPNRCPASVQQGIAIQVFQIQGQALWPWPISSIKAFWFQIPNTWGCIQPTAVPCATYSSLTSLATPSAMCYSLPKSTYVCAFVFCLHHNFWRFSGKSNQQPRNLQENGFVGTNCSILLDKAYDICHCWFVHNKSGMSVARWILA